ncbi:PDZ domain-containing protein [Lysobacter sp. TY2-98]|uniref:PDZ domain-containing protein n=1 Tax=Lysobacter sp. TY2-98 TaxID=2290922 RepID=UPI000E205538|nr:PDZ domain-containing protein [Lysobacter sp. TY2-98]AXK73304.1 PDZ domain-containing protein [Lysobacter sp. TY2-98]
MFRPTALRAATAAGLACALAVTPASAAKGHLGFAVEVETAGFFLTPSLERVQVTRVIAASPAANAGLRAGDAVIDIDGVAIKGAPAKPLAEKLKSVEPGDHLRMTVRHADGRVATLDLVAGR